MNIVPAEKGTKGIPLDKLPRVIQKVGGVKGVGALPSMIHSHPAELMSVEESQWSPVNQEESREKIFKKYVVMCNFRFETI